MTPDRLQMNEDLKPCPFCGSIPTISKYVTDREKNIIIFRLICEEDDCVMQRHYFDTEKKAIKAWNRRV